MNKINLPIVSVIIPVFNDADSLKICLQALDDQTYPKNLYEVIVVDNGSKESIEPIVREFKQARATYENQPGSYIARNKGISVATGEIIAFTDSDCIPASNWIEKGVSNLQRIDHCGLVAGKIEIFLKDLNSPTAVEIYDSLYAFPQNKYVAEYKFGVTANLFTFKTVFEKVGLFNPSLKSGGDYEWGWRVYSSGYQLLYAEDSCVAHPARRSFSELSKKTIRVIKGHYELKKTKIYPPAKFILGSIADLLVPFRSVPIVLLDKRLKGWNQKIKVIGVMVRIRYVKGWEKLRLELGELFTNMKQYLRPGSSKST